MLIEYGPGVSSTDRDAITAFYDESPKRNARLPIRAA